MSIGHSMYILGVMVRPSLPIICRWCTIWLALNKCWNLSFIEYSATTRWGIWWPGYFLHRTMYIFLTPTCPCVPLWQCGQLHVNYIGFMALVHSWHDISSPIVCTLGIFPEEHMALHVWSRWVLLKLWFVIDSGDRSSYKTIFHICNLRKPSYSHTLNITPSCTCTTSEQPLRFSVPLKL